MITQSKLICIVAFLFFLISSPTMASALPACADLATNPTYGLAGNPVVTSATSTVVPVSGSNAAYCNVQITYSSRGGPEYGYAVGESQHIKIGIGLPLNSVDGGTGGDASYGQGAWNGRVQNLGGGVCAGSVGPTTSATNARYVGSSTDTGHTQAENGTRCNFGVIQETHELNLGLIDDFIYEGVHQQVVWAKAVAETYYGKPVFKNYWNGCSTGGRQGLALAQEYGYLLDGFIVGAPAIYWQAFRLSDSWPYLVVKDTLTAIGKSITNAQWSAVNAAAMDACDVMGPDAVEDGLIYDPRHCNFSATANICGEPGAPSSPDCLDADQADAIDMIWDGPRNSHGKRIYYPFDRGISLNSFLINLFPNFSTSQVLSYDHVDLTYPVANLYLDPAAIADAGFPPDAIAYEDEATLSSRTVGDYMETQDVNLDKVRGGHRGIFCHHLDKFKGHGGKIIMWHGMADPLIRWRGSKDYYRRVATYYGHGKADFARLQSWFRYFPAPGVGHCGGGGPSPVNIFDVLVNWVENGVEPDSILASGGGRTRPLCPFPQTAIYKGAPADPNVADSFYCGGNLETHDVICNDLRTLYKYENGYVLDFLGVDGWECLRWPWPHGHP